MKQYLKDHPEVVMWVVSTLIALSGGGAMAWHHHKYHGHDKPAVQQSQQYKMSDEETRLKIHQDIEEKGQP